jgi:hypothetical protein
MGKVLVIVNGIPTLEDAAVSISTYEETLIISSDTSANTPITLPNSGSYTDKELEVFYNNISQEVTTDYNYVGSGSGKTQISFTFDIRTGDHVRFRKISS